jgi:hypothetical protein
MKNKAQSYLHVLKKILPHWSGTDVGHTAGRDWFTALALATLVGATLVGVGAYRLMSTNKSVDEAVATIPVRGLPTSEERIQQAEALFVARSSEFKDFSESVPTAPDPGKEQASMVPEEQAENGSPE